MFVFLIHNRESLISVVANLMNCDITVSDFELQLYNYVYFRSSIFGKGMNPFFP